MKKILLSTLICLLCAINNLNAQWLESNTGLTDPNEKYIRSFGVNGTYVFAGTAWGAYLSTDIGNNWNAANSGCPAWLYAFAINGSDIFIATQWGVYLSTDNGNNWTAKNNGLPDVPTSQVNSIIISGSNIFAGTAEDGVYLSTNNGNNWTAKNNGLTATSIRTLAKSGSTIFVSANYLGGAFRSMDNGENWTLIGEGLTGPITCFAVNGSNIFAGTDGGGVCLSTDNGNLWAPLNNGLTNLFITSLAVSGSTVIAGTTFGGVFASINLGENWYDEKIDSNFKTINALTIVGTTVFAGTEGDGIWKRALSEMGTDITEINLNASFNIYPNPFNNEITICNLNKNSKNNSGEFSLIDMTGKEILHKNISSPETKINTENISSGFYLLHYSDGINSENFKLVKF